VCLGVIPKPIFSPKKNVCKPKGLFGSMNVIVHPLLPPHIFIWFGQTPLQAAGGIIPRSELERRRSQRLGVKWERARALTLTCLAGSGIGGLRCAHVRDFIMELLNLGVNSGVDFVDSFGPCHVWVALLLQRNDRHLDSRHVTRHVASTFPHLGRIRPGHRVPNPQQDGSRRR
jgi:hypothetical protein